MTVEPTAIQEGLVDLYRVEDQHEAAYGHAERCPDLSARRVLTFSQKVAAFAMIAAIVAGLAVAAIETVIALVAAATLFYVVTIGYKCLLAFRAMSGARESPGTPEELARLNDDELPVYTLILPLYREAEVLAELVNAIESLDYPKDRLDVKLLLEEDDAETQAAAARLCLPPYFQTLIVPAQGPIGKPRACNYALLHARGDYCVIFDAEDRPESDQLKKAVMAFSKGDPQMGCVQAKLSYYNPDQNLLTKWFTAEYAAWFDLYLPGLNSLGAPLPLGGTSNHFPVDLLRQIGGWDPFNVTEDADLGIRLARLGWRTAVIDSVTYEEANSRLGNWIRQRSRWVKGYMQTWLVHMRNPVQLLRELGPGGFLAFQVMVFGTFFAYLVNPIFWVLVALWYATGWGVIEAVYPAPVFYVSLLALFFGNAALVYMGILACLRRGYYRGVRYALLMPFYWLLMTIPAVYALCQLVTKPHYWEKTAHGLTPEGVAALSTDAVR